MELPENLPDEVKCFVCVNDMKREDLGIFVIKFKDPEKAVAVILCPECYDYAEKNMSITHAIVKARINAMLIREGYDPL